MIKAETNNKSDNKKCIKCRGPTVVKLTKTREGGMVRIVQCKICRFYISEDLL